ncbi:coenzyme Q-binding protein COQ10 [Amorphus orientalis]|uniref:Coenzyme Q-binding protein COQ10 n=1 Tax=Amorphus orientalis TaxID=649198 RepID=A0AAE3VTX9_9HYPH|nr:coenzyme Q-binding protein COQ10 [Amorphus orientalis]
MNHSAEDMFDLVADVEKYPNFVPLCQSLSVRGRREQGDGTEVLVADMTVAYRFIRETFTSRVVLDRANRTIFVEYLDGPFRHMENRWTFKPVDDEHSEVGFYINYEFKSRALSAVMGSVFDRAFRKFATAFEERADEVYGT